ncbi:MAG: hypothetical protein MJ051_07110 [Akkermansia sp.]|nr:hypothetical protein [Akkermansia sp.]
MRVLPLLLLAAALPLSAQEPAAAPAQDAQPAAIVYFEKGADTAAISKSLAPYRNSGADGELKFKPLTTQCRSVHDAAHAAEALAAGVTELPCLVLRDAEGPYAALPLRTLTKEAVQAAQQSATAPDRAEQADARLYTAKQYLLFARMALTKPMEEETLGLCLTSCRTLMEHPLAQTEDKQLLGLRCLYPLLLEEYRRGYAAEGAHTPATEAKLLEAIAALETARDLAPDTKLGQQAAAERERLRAARRQARTAE